MYNLQIFFICFYIVFVTHGIYSAVKYPVIFIPGDGGSQMEAKLNKTSVVHYICDKKTDNFFSLWLNMELLMPLVIDCLIDNMKLVYDNKTRTTSNSPGVEIRIPGFGNSSCVEWIDPSKASEGCYFKDIGSVLVNLGYERNYSLRGAPYDFRKGPNELGSYFSALKNLIEDTYVTNNNKKVILIVHSLGALISLHLLHNQPQSWKDKYIRAMISLAGVWGGSVKALKVYAMGDDLGVYVLRSSVLRTEQITSPSLAYLLPSTFLWKPDEVLVETAQKNYSLNNLKDFFYDIDYMNGWEMYKDVLPFANNFDPPGIELHCLYTSGIPTVEKLIYPANKFPNGSPKLIYGDGDGTVNRRSLQSCTYWKNLQKQRVNTVIFKGADHMGMLKNVDVVQYVYKLVQNIN